MDSYPRILKIEGDPSVAEIAVVQMRPGKPYAVETVDGLAPPLSRANKWIINISTQFGCPIGCPFCDAALEFAGNLEASEMLWQVRWALERHPEQVTTCRKLKVHFARMGEPALNDAVLEVLEELPSLVRCPNLWACVATVAPRGREKWFERIFAIKEKLYRCRFQLQFSVQSTSESDRCRLIPAPHLDLQELARLGKLFYRPGDRKVVLNFALACDVEFEPERIAEFFHPSCFAIKITPVNPTASGQRNGFRTILRSERENMLSSACQRLQEFGFDVVISVGDGREDWLGSNCGQALRIVRTVSFSSTTNPAAGLAN